MHIIYGKTTQQSRNILNVTPTVGGTIDISIKGDGANIGYLGIIQLTEHN